MNIVGDHDDKTLEQLAEVAEHAERVALMADGHMGYSMPIGGVAAYRNKVSVTGVGFDIACGNCAVKTNLRPEDVDLLTLGHKIQDTLAFGIGKENPCPTGELLDHQVFADERWDLIPEKYRGPLYRKAWGQLGTIGSGNHYVDILVDEEGYLWVGVHFGSRGFGHTLATAFIAISQGGVWGERGKEDMCLLDLSTPGGEDYWALMNLAGEYAYAGRDWVANTVAEWMGSETFDRVHNNHNFAWEETHQGEDLIVVRKGATPAFPGQRGFVGGSMGDDAVILQGKMYDPSGSAGLAEYQEALLYSTVHGAGRVMSRTAATGRNRRGKKKAEPRVDRAETLEWIKKRGVLVFGAELDEAPQAYRRLDEVLAAQGDTVEIVHRLRPLVVVMAPGSFDAAGKPLNPFLV